jgi:hypothetical protein
MGFSFVGEQISSFKPTQLVGDGSVLPKKITAVPVLDLLCATVVA